MNQATPAIMRMIEDLSQQTPDDTATASWIRNASEALLLAADHIETLEQELETMREASGYASPR